MSWLQAILDWFLGLQIYLPIAEISLNIVLLLAIGGGVGLLSGLFGVGGGFLMTPLLIFIGVPPAVAVATQSNQIVASSVSGLLAHWARDNVDFKMGSVLLAGGIVGSSIGVYLFGLLRHFGQIDLVIAIAYVVTLGTVGIMMGIESLNALRRIRKMQGQPAKLHQHNWAQGLPFKMRFRKSRLYISAMLPAGIGFLVGIMSAVMGVGGAFPHGAGDDLSAGHADRDCGRHLAVPDHLRAGLCHVPAIGPEPDGRHPAGADPDRWRRRRRAARRPLGRQTARRTASAADGDADPGGGRRIAGAAGLDPADIFRSSS